MNKLMLNHTPRRGGKMKLLVFAALLSFLAYFAYAAVPNTMNFQAKLTDTSNVLLTDTYNFTFRIFNVASGGTYLWSENQVIYVDNGIVNALLGNNTPLNLSFDESYWLEIRIGSETLTPRRRLATSGYSFRANTSEDLVCTTCVDSTDIASNAVTASKIASGAVTSAKLSEDLVLQGNLSASSNLFYVANNTRYVGINTTTPTQTLTVIGRANITGGNSAKVGLFVDDGGRIGIGTGALENRIGNANGSMIDISSTAGGTLAIHYRPSGTYGEFTLSKGINGNFIDAAGGNSADSNDMIFRTGGTLSDFSVTERMKITGAGDLIFDTNTLFVNASANRVGIGTANPITALDVRGDLNVSGIINGSLADNIVTSSSIASNAVTTAKIANSAVTSAKLASDLSLSGNLTVNTSVLFVSGTLGRAGIGTTSPITALDVRGDLNVTGYVNTSQVCIGSVCRTEWPAAIAGWATTATLVYNDTPGVNVSIGTSANAPVGYKVLVIGSVNITGILNASSLADNIVTSTAIASNAVTSAKIANGAVTSSKLAQDLTLEGNLSAGSNIFYVSNNTRAVGINTTTPTQTLTVVGTVNITGGAASVLGLIVDDQGRVSIGIGSPSYKLHAVSDDAFNQSVTDMFVLDHTTTAVSNGTNGIGVGILFRTEDTARDVENVTLIQGLLTTATNTSETSALTFWTRTGGNNLSERMRITGVGLVGINTTTPTQTLTVIGDINATGTIYGTINATASDLECTGCIGSNDLASNAVTASKIASGAVTSAKLAQDLVLEGNLSVASSLFYVANNTRYVGINTTAPTQTLTVVGTANITGGASSVVGLVVDSRGRVGIGTSNTSQPLTVYGAVNITNGNLLMNGNSIKNVALAVSTQLPSPNLTAYWPFEEGMGTAVRDASFNGNDATTNATWTNAGRYGRALSFDGIDDRVRIPNPLANQNFTVEAWVYFRGGTDGTIIGDRVAGSANVWQLQTMDDQRFNFNWGAAGNGTTFTSSFPKNVWTHVVVVVNGTSTGGRAKAWVNGVGGTAQPIDTLAAPGTVLWIGSYDTSGFFNGTIDEVKLWNAALSDEEAAALYRQANPLGNIVVNDTGNSYFVGGGKVGINTTTPTHTLTVVGTANITGGASSVEGLLVGNTGNVSIGTAAFDKFVVYGGNITYITGSATVGSTGGIRFMTSTATNAYSAFVYAERDSTDGSNLLFGTTSTIGASTPPTERMRIDRNGNVGIGTASPQDKLHVSGSVAGNLRVLVSNTDTAQSSLLAFGQTTTGDTPVYLRRFNSAHATRASELEITSADAAGFITFFTGGNAASNERMRITASGNVGIGTAAIPPNQVLLHIDRSDGQLMRFSHSGTTANWTISMSNLYFNLHDSAAADAGTALGPIKFAVAPGQTGIGINRGNPGQTLDVNGSIRVATLAADSATHVCRDGNNDLSTCSSSAKFKTDINNLSEQQLSSILEQIRNTNVASFRYKNDRPNLTRFGIIAEDAPKPLQIIDENNNTNIDFYSYYGGYTWAGIKALDREVQLLDNRTIELQKENSALKKENAALKSRLATLESDVAEIKVLLKDGNGGK